MSIPVSRWQHVAGPGDCDPPEDPRDWDDEPEPVTVSAQRALERIADCLEGKSEMAFGMDDEDWVEFILEDLSRAQRLTLALFILEPGRLPSLMHDMRRGIQRNAAGRVNELLAEMPPHEAEASL